MNYLDYYIQEKLKECYSRIFKLNSSNKSYRNKWIEYANTRDKIRIFEMVIVIKKKHDIDYSDDQQRINFLLIELDKIGLKRPFKKMYK